MSVVCLAHLLLLVYDLSLVSQRFFSADLEILHLACDYEIRLLSYRGDLSLIHSRIDTCVRATA